VPGVGEHPPPLALQHGGSRSLPCVRQTEQLVVGNAAPQKEGEARRELDICDPVGPCSRGESGAGADPDAEPGANSVRNRNEGLTRMRCTASSMPASEVAVGAASA